MPTMQRHKAHIIVKRVMVPTVFLAIVYLILRVTDSTNQIVTSDVITGYWAKLTTASPSITEFINSLNITPKNPEQGEVLLEYEKMMFNNDYKFSTDYTIQKNILDPAGVNSLNDVGHYNMDPRLYSSVLLHLLSTSGNDKKVPFSWYDFTDNHDYNKLLKLNDFILDPHKEPSTAKECPIDCTFLLRSQFPTKDLTYLEDLIQEPLFYYDRALYDDAFFQRKMNKYSSPVLPSDVGKYCILHTELFSANTAETTQEESKRKHLFTPYMEITNLMDRGRPEVYALQARNYVFNHLSMPLSMTMLNSFHESYQFEIDQANNGSNFIQSGTLQKILQESPDFNFNNVHSLFDKFLSENTPLQTNDHLANMKKKLTENLLVDLQDSNDDENISLWEFNATRKISELEKNPNLNFHEARYLQNLKHSITQHYSQAPKSFHEPSGIIQFDGAGRHFDNRFFNGKKFYKEKFITQIHLNHLIKVFLKFTKANGLLTWISHGNMYGYLYNGKNFYWDNDIDVQMPITHLNLLAQYFNQTIVVEDPREGSGRYLVDVGQNLLVRHNGNGQNNIDARFIDVDSGLYIDITGLSYSSDLVTKYFFDDYKNTYNLDNKKLDTDDANTKLKDPHSIIYKDPNSLYEYSDMTADEYLDYIVDRDVNDTLSQSLLSDLQNQKKNEKKALQNGNSPTKNLSPAERYSINKDMKIVNCRNRHFTPLNQLSPLMSTMFHNIPALVPHQMLKVLKDEYSIPYSYAFTLYKDFIFLPQFKDWVDKNYVLDAANLSPNSEADLENPSELEIWTKTPFSEPLDTMSLQQAENIILNLCDSDDEHKTFYVSNLINGFMQSTYRLKELELIHDDSISREEKLQAWKDMFQQVGISKISKQNIFKDPYLFSLEYRNFLQNEKNVQSDDFSMGWSQYKKKICFKNVKDLFVQMEQSESRKLPLFITEAQDFNKMGKSLYKSGASVYANDNLIFNSEFWSIPDGTEI
ncbi:hypothetical protein ACO0QE_003272 [Hanseniaspora vineae]